MKHFCAVLYENNPFHLYPNSVHWCHFLLSNSNYDGKTENACLSPSLQDTLQQLIVMPLPDILCIARDPISGNASK